MGHDLLSLTRDALSVVLWVSLPLVVVATLAGLGVAQAANLEHKLVWDVSVGGTKVGTRSLTVKLGRISVRTLNVASMARPALTPDWVKLCS